MELVISGANLKLFKLTITTLTKFGEEIDISISSEYFRLSSVNSTRSAFGVIAFEPSFFSSYSIPTTGDGNESKSFSVTGKALLAPLKSRSTNTIESCSISLVDDDDSEEEEGVELGGKECRLVIRLFCQHGVIKTHRLTYGKSASLFAKVDRARCTSYWTASSRVLKDWIDHFHLKLNTQSGGTEEISFHLDRSKCRLRSFETTRLAEDSLLNKPLATELLVDVEDFDQYQVVGTPLVTFALKEFKAIIALAEGDTLTTAFSDGGQPIVMEIRTESFSADFVIATTGFDSDEREESVKPEKSGSHKSSSTHKSKEKEKEKEKGKEKEKVPLFRPQSEEQEEDEEEDEFGMMIDFGEEDLAAIDLLSQLPPTGMGAGSQSVGSKFEAKKGKKGESDKEGDGMRYEEEEGDDQEEEKEEMVQLGPTQTRTQERWNLSPS